MTEISSQPGKLIVVADESGNILSAVWPGESTGDAPSQIGLVVPADGVVHEVTPPAELSGSAPPDLGNYILKSGDGGAELVKRTPESSTE